MNTSDRELLEAAAKAAGIEVDFTVFSDGSFICFQKGGDCFHDEWNPLTDDGDALRLATKRQMTLAFEPSRGGWSVGAIVNGEFRWLAHDDDVRRAIVRAAAAIGRDTHEHE